MTCFVQSQSMTPSGGDASAAATVSCTGTGTVVLTAVDAQNSTAQDSMAVTIGQAPACGNGLCDQGETNQNCPADCTLATCGNAVCDGGETNQNCPVDCPLQQPVCGNGICEQGEDSISCLIDCPAPEGAPAGVTGFSVSDAKTTANDAPSAYLLQGDALEASMTIVSNEGKTINLCGKIINEPKQEIIGQAEICEANEKTINAGVNEIVFEPSTSFDLASLTPGIYWLELKVYEATQAGDTLIGLKRIAFTLAEEQQPLPVPDNNPLIIVLVLAAISLILLKK
ncbi:hypothetical protein HZB89_02500 [archaeon]|nr:hypothetical protein [archaeon]